MRRMISRNRSYPTDQRYTLRSIYGQQCGVSGAIRKCFHQFSTLCHETVAATNPLTAQRNKSLTMTVEKRTESNVQQAVPFFWVNDLERSVRFYVEGLGFEMTKEWTEGGKLRWCWLELGNAALMLQEFWKAGNHANLPEGKPGVGVSINFICKDALAIYRDLAAHGVPASRPSVGNGMWVTHVQDPDGYNLSFESPTNVPEDTASNEEL